MKIKKISLTTLSNREINRKEKSILSGGRDCGCAGVCLGKCGCTYIELYTAQDFMGQAAHLATYDSDANNPSGSIMTEISRNAYK